MPINRFGHESLSPGFHGQRGAILPLMAIGIVSILGVMGLSLDVANVVSARQDLENAADSAALAGAHHLTKGTTIPNFTTALAAAQAAIANNKVAGTPVVAATVQTGGWDLTGARKGLLPFVQGQDLAPAVEVQITKSGSNGVLQSLFSKVLGISSFSPQFASVAVGDISPTTIDPHQLMPLAISQCIYDQYWDAATQKPKLATKTTPLCTTCNNQTIGQPYTFRIVGSYAATPGNCPASGQWTSFGVVDNSDSETQRLIQGGNPLALSLNDQVWINTGAKTNSYRTISDLGLPYAAFIPIVSGGVNQGTWESVSGFACVKITASLGGSNKYVEMQLLPVSTDTIPGATNSPPFVCMLKGSGATAKAYLVRPAGLANYFGDVWP